MDKQERYRYDVKRIVWLLFVNVTSIILLLSLYWSFLTDLWQLGMALAFAAIGILMVVMWVIRIRAQHLLSSSKHFTTSTNFP